jgi:Na+-transporting methylmalonyl-CoA/oxaloacetate decarboxylase gamma subunit
MDNLTFGLTLLVVGMGGTLLTLFIMALIIQALTAIFPVKEEDEK